MHGTKFEIHVFDALATLLVLNILCQITLQSSHDFWSEDQDIGFLVTSK